MKRTTGIVFLLLFVLVTLLSSCAAPPQKPPHHYLSKQMLRDQMSSQEKLKTKTPPMVVPTTGPIVGMNFAYDSDNLPWILCYDQDRRKVYVSVDHNTVLIITDKEGKSHKMYLDTLYLIGEILCGVSSRTMGSESSVPMASIDRIEVSTELSRKTPGR